MKAFLNSHRNDDYLEWQKRLEIQIVTQMIVNFTHRNDYDLKWLTEMMIFFTTHTNDDDFKSHKW